MDKETSEYLGPVLLLSFLEAAVNRVITTDPAAVQALATFCGKVIRIKTSQPRLSVYVVFCDDGVQLHNQFDGDVDARIQTTASSLALIVLGANDVRESDKQFSVSGNQQLVDELVQISERFNFWQTVSRLIDQWLPEYVSLERLISLIERQEPDWLKQIQQIVFLSDCTLAELRSQVQMQRSHAQELATIRRYLMSQQRRWHFYFWVGVLMVAAAAGIGSGVLSMNQVIYWPLEAQIIGGIGVGLIVTRMGIWWGGRSD